jgi:hypothetical protein
VLVDMVGFTGSGFSLIAWKNFGENLPERAARLVAERKMPPAIVVFPDCFTAPLAKRVLHAHPTHRDHALRVRHVPARQRVHRGSVHATN